MFAFTCRCEECAAPVSERDATDRLLIRYQQLAPKWSNLNLDPDTTAFRSFALDNQSRDDIAEATGILRRTGRTKELGELYDLSFRIAALSGRKREAVTAARIAAEHFSNILGKDSPVVESYYGFALDPMTWDSWGRIIDEDNSLVEGSGPESEWRYIPKKSSRESQLVRLQRSTQRGSRSSTT
jgi:hypothetical protein